MITGTILSIERGCLHDGPGLRTTVFLKGCPLSCLWCHNPESQSFEPELYFLDEKCVNCGLCKTVCHRNRKLCNTCANCVQACPHSALEIKGLNMSVGDIINIALKDKHFYEHSGGGMTISGGEPLAQFDFTRSLLRCAKENGLHTCIETCGFAPTLRLLELIPYVDLFLYDYKVSDDIKHKKFTGVSNSLIIDNLLAIDKAGAITILRCPIIPTYNDCDSHFSAIAKIANNMRHITEINIMPYHPMGKSKAARIGRKYPMVDPGFPTEEQIDDWINKISRQTTVAVING